MTHGTLSGYIHGGCRCESCTDANRVQNRKRRRSSQQQYAKTGPRYQLTPEEQRARRSCLICQTSIATHPLKSCWRTI